MKNGIGYITISDGKVHFLMRLDKKSEMLRFSASAASESAALNAVVGYASTHKLKLEHVVVAVDGSKCILKNYRFPMQSARQIDQVLGFELEEDVPFEPEFMVSDYFRGDYRRGESVVCAAAQRKESVASLLSLFSEQAIVVDVLDVDVAAFARTCISLFPGQGRKVGLDIGQNRTLFCHLEEGKVQQLAVIPWGEKSLVDAVVQSGKFSPDAVDRMMVFPDADQSLGDGSVLRAQSKEFLKRLLREVSRQLGGGALPDHFILSGDIVRMQDFCELFSNLSQARLDVWDEFYFEPGEEADQGLRGSGLATAYGTAEQTGPGFNMRKEEFALPHSLAGWKRDLQSLVMLVGLVCVAWGGNAYATHVAQVRELAALQMATLQVYREALPDVGSSLAPVQYQSILSSRLDNLISKADGNATYDGLTVIEILRTVSASLKEDIDVELLNFSLDNKRIGFRGECQAMGDVESVRKAMVGTGSFREVVIRSAVADKSVKRVRFEIEALR